MAEPTVPASSWVPTRKWLAQVVVGAIGLAVMLLTGDSEITDPEIVAIGGWATAGLASYIYPNEATATGTGVRAKRPSGQAGYSLVEVGLFLLLLAIALAVFFAVVDV